MLIPRSAVANNVINNHHKAEKYYNTTSMKINNGQKSLRTGDSAKDIVVSDNAENEAAKLNQIYDNLQNSVSVLQTTDTGLSQLKDLLDRLKILLIRAATGTSSSQNIKDINYEVQQLIDEFNKLPDRVQFNRNKLLHVGENEQEFKLKLHEVEEGLTPELYNLSLPENGSAGDQSDGDWSPDGNKIVYTSDNDIWVMNSDGTGKRRLTNTADNGWAVWSPVTDTNSPYYNKILFTSTRNGFTDIYMMDADDTVEGSSISRLTQNNVHNLHPDWAFDGNKIYYSSQLGVNINRMDPDGGNQETLESDYTPDTIYIDNEVSVSPQGDKIAFSSRKGDLDKWDLWVMNSEGRGDYKITDTPEYSEYGSTWSPDGSKIAYNTVEDNAYKLYSVDANGDNKQLISENGGWPDWSPDGTKLLFESERNNSSGTDLWTIDSDGEKDTYLSKKPVEGSVKIYINGNEVPESDTDGVTITGQKIVFNGSYVPSPSDKVTAKYYEDTDFSDYELLLNDPVSLNHDIQVTINGVAINEGYTVDGNKLTLDKTVLQPGELSIKVKYVPKTDFIEHSFGLTENIKTTLPVNITEISNLVNSIDITKSENIEDDIGSVERAEKSLEKIRNSIGALQNRLQDIDNLTYDLGDMNLRLSARVRDIDITKELIYNIKSSILNQVSAKIIGDVNSQSRKIIQLLK